MPLFEYKCPSTGSSFEVIHRSDEHIQTWGELCEKLGLPLGDLKADSPVVKQYGTKLAVLGAQPSACAAPGSMPRSAGCCGGMCKKH
ncbi:MAG: zinc ribbon domain-containing protein [Bdellovibrionales bacterium]|nr:zinc ribbon domain-containing protein [Bdellovibrionales bacterium]